MANGGSGCTGSTSGPPCEDNPRTPKVILRSQGFIVLAFGLALGITFMIFYGILQVKGVPGTALGIFVNDLRLDPWLSFAYGFIGGTAVAAIYNLLVVRRLNLFGVEGNVD